jgi:alginate O-acetyltransferase complex protein AlgI
MTFISLEFIVFFNVVIFACFVLPHRWRLLMLLIASYVFYAYGGFYNSFILITSTLVDFVAARKIEATQDVRRRRLFLAVSMAMNLGILFILKYFNFFNDSFALLFERLNIPYHVGSLDVILPIGISFYTFQTMSYTIDVYRGHLKAEKNLGVFALFVVFFPQLVAGPIERASNMLPQFLEKHAFDFQRAVEGLQLILWGFFKKVVIGDRIAVFANAVYNQPTSYTGLPLILATVFFAFQIYCDFSAYSDIAIGSAKIMGFRLMDNFRQPYFSQSVREFWGRWHISLSTWFRDYLYIPLGGNRVSLSRNLLNFMIVFLVSGLWHGANWTFVIWGGLHGLFVAGDVLQQRLFPDRYTARKTPLGSLLRVLGTFVLVCFAWVFFRANTASDAFYIAGNLLNFAPLDGIESLARIGGWTVNEFWMSFALIGLLLAVDWLDARWGLLPSLKKTPVVLRWGFYYAATAAVFIAVNSGAVVQQFIYFRF